MYFITKPYNPVIFLSKVRIFLEREKILKDLQNEIKERKLTEAKKLLEKTAQLEAANRELESFSYSVSHDFEVTPACPIDGFSKMLLSDHKDGLDTETVRKLRVIRENAQKMGLLIDDLLDFSRLGQNSLHFSRVNMENIVDEIWAELREIYPDRKMELLKNDLPTASGDYHLLKLVVQNLLSNAAKFSKFLGNNEKYRLAGPGELMRPFSILKTTAQDLICVSTINSSASSSVYTLRTNTKVRESGLRMCSALYIATAAGSGPKGKSTKERPFISRFRVRVKTWQNKL